MNRGLGFRRGIASGYLLELVTKATSPLPVVSGDDDNAEEWLDLFEIKSLIRLSMSKIYCVGRSNIMRSDDKTLMSDSFSYSTRA